MSRLFVQVEGQTEETFVNELLRPHLIAAHGFHDVSAKLMGNARARRRRGGIRGWPEVRKEIIVHLKTDPRKFVTTMVDFYGLPAREPDQPLNPKAWPGRDTARAVPFARKAAHVEAAIHADISADVIDARIRFIPFVLMHEFEALLFSDPERFAAGIGRPEIAADLSQIVDQFSGPEEINDRPSTAPSKRIQEVFSQRQIGHYEKPISGVLGAIEIGLERMRNACPHFSDWLTRLEAIPHLK